ncbi:hypothetical protein T03_16424 [Trichinella britovi]|uniref:Uncharacterized protein n=1 Tax=Trichinella britovi TaxID=45882 RepID=A0A0V1BU88_TRIBR|nr:hypothetical protein T03_16424 [Trichinella britovi]
MPKIWYKKAQQAMKSANESLTGYGPSTLPLRNCVLS